MICVYVHNAPMESPPRCLVMPRSSSSSHRFRNRVPSSVPALSATYKSVQPANGVSGPSPSSIRSASRTERGVSRLRLTTDPGMLSCALDGVVDRHVAGAPADVAGKTGLHLRAGWCGSERNGREDHAGRADPTLRAAEFHKRALQWMAGAESFDRCHAAAGRRVTTIEG